MTDLTKYQKAILSELNISSWRLNDAALLQPSPDDVAQLEPNLANSVIDIVDNNTNEPAKLKVEESKGPQPEVLQTEPLKDEPTADKKQQCGVFVTPDLIAALGENAQKDVELTIEQYAIDVVCDISSSQASRMFSFQDAMIEESDVMQTDNNVYLVNLADLTDIAWKKALWKMLSQHAQQ